MPPEPDDFKQKPQHIRAGKEISDVADTLVNNTLLTKTQLLARKLGRSAAKAGSELADWVLSYAEQLYRLAATQDSPKLIKDMLTDCWKRAKSQWVTTAAQLQGWSNALLTTELARTLASWTAETFNKNFDKYDEMIDKAYNAGVGSSTTHHLVDGSHTLLGAIREASKAYEDDSAVAEIWNAVEHLLRDLASISGINPVFSLTNQHLKDLKDFAELFGISKSWVNDFLLINVPEVLGAFFAVVPVWFGWSKLECERFAEIAGSAGIAALLSANPLLGLIALVAMARSFNLVLSQEKESLKQAASKGGLGALQTSVVYAASAAIAGPEAIGIVVGLVIAYSIRQYASSHMTHAEMLDYLARVYETRVFPSIRASGEASLALFDRLRQMFQFA